jgi:hypothetical protein
VVLTISQRSVRLGVVCGPREPQWERINGKERRPTTTICALPNKPKHGEGLPTWERIPPPYPLGRSSEATFTSTRQRSGNGTSSCIASGSTLDLSLHESDRHLPTRPPHPRKSPPLCYFSPTARDLLIHYAWRYHCFVEYTLEGLTAAVSRPSLHVVIRFSDPKSAFSIQNSIQLFDIRPRCRAAIRSCSRRSSHNETSRL